MNWILSPKVAAVFVIVVMLAAFGYASWTSRQAASAYALPEDRAAVHADRLENAIQQAEEEMTMSP